ncbi:hypothetical protein Tco_0727420 [Tanacetum coccineum]|uniref:Xylulose kinase-1 n=1 Tax=Tanacetum coccineum TaxID=301880 RepID=A0ABQ4YIC5_9ASTR
MTTLKFANTHNMVVFLAKPAESEGFVQIVDFLNAYTIKCALTINPTIYTSCIEQFWATVKAKTINGEVQLQALVDRKKIIITESIIRRDLQLEDAEGVDCLPNATIFEQLTLMGRSKRKDTEVPQPSGPTTNVADEAVNEEMDDSLVRAATTASSLEAEQDSGNIDKTQSKATPNEPSSPKTSSSGGPRRQETIGDIIAQTRSENVSKLSNDPLLARVLALETTKTTQANEIAGLKRRVKKLERRNKSRTHGLKRLYKVGSSRRVESSDGEGLGKEDASKQEMIADIDANKDIYLVNVHTDKDMFGVNDLDGDEVIVDNVDVVKTAEETRSVVKEVTIVIKKAKLVSAAEETVNAAATSVSTASTIPVSAAITTTTTTIIVSDVEITLAQALAELKSAKPKTDKVVIQEPELGTTTTTPITIISIPKPPQNKGKGIMIKEHVVEQVKPMKRLEQIRLDEELAFKLQAKIEADYQLAQRLQAQEQEELTDEEKARLTELVEENSKKAEAEITQERSSKIAREELKQESSKKQKVEEDKETAELQILI